VKQGGRLTNPAVSEAGRGPGWGSIELKADYLGAPAAAAPGEAPQGPGQGPSDPTSFASQPGGWRGSAGEELVLCEREMLKHLIGLGFSCCRPGCWFMSCWPPPETCCVTGC